MTKNIPPSVSQNWRNHPIMWIIGCIDSNGHITANPSKEGRSHRKEESRGKRWRWCVWSQEMITLVGKTVDEINHPEKTQLTEEEYFLVCDWLIRNKYASAEILPEPNE